MLHVKVNQGNVYHIENANGKCKINGEDEIFDCIKLADGRFHILKDHQSYTVEVVELNKSTKEMVLKINGVICELSAQDKFDVLMAQMGISAQSNTKQAQLKAPMPGKVIDVVVVIGQLVKQGETLLILEAMKMENVLKASHDVVISQIIIQQGDTVDKGQVLLVFA
jgi:biotin carboxyl carrier protein